MPLYPMPNRSPATPWTTDEDPGCSLTLGLKSPLASAWSLKKP